MDPEPVIERLTIEAGFKEAVGVLLFHRKRLAFQQAFHRGSMGQERADDPAGGSIFVVRQNMRA